jgi:hypothetical protein
MKALDDFTLQLDELTAELKARQCPGTFSSEYRQDKATLGAFYGFKVMSFFAVPIVELANTRDPKHYAKSVARQLLQYALAECERNAAALREYLGKEQPEPATVGEITPEDVAGMQEIGRNLLVYNQHPARVMPGTNPGRAGE